MKVREPRSKKHSRESLALAVSSDGRYLATGGVDRHVHIWDVRTREHVQVIMNIILFWFCFVVWFLPSRLSFLYNYVCLQAFPGHRNTVSCLCFRHGTTELYSGSFDRSVKAWNVEDKAFVQDSFGHQDEILAIDALRKERALTVGRDRTMLLHKVIDYWVETSSYGFCYSVLSKSCFI